MTIANLQDFRSNTPRALVSVPTETEARGFALYLGVDEAAAAAAGTTLSEIANALKKTFAELVPSAANQTYAAVALAPKGAGGRSVDVVRTALRDPRALDQLREPETDEPAIKVDLLRKRVYKNGTNVDFTNKEFLLLVYLIENVGQVVSRSTLVEATSGSTDSDEITDRTIDVHVRRLRAKIEGYEDVIRAVRGQGYIFEQHPDLIVER